MPQPLPSQNASNASSVPIVDAIVDNWDINYAPNRLDGTINPLANNPLEHYRYVKTTYTNGNQNREIIPDDGKTDRANLQQTTI